MPRFLSFFVFPAVMLLAFFAVLIGLSALETKSCAAPMFEERE